MVIKINLKQKEETEMIFHLKLEKLAKKRNCKRTTT